MIYRESSKELSVQKGAAGRHTAQGDTRFRAKKGEFKSDVYYLHPPT